MASYNSLQNLGKTVIAAGILPSSSQTTANQAPCPIPYPKVSYSLRYLHFCNCTQSFRFLILPHVAPLYTTILHVELPFLDVDHYHSSMSHLPLMALYCLLLSPLIGYRILSDMKLDMGPSLLLSKMMIKESRLQQPLFPSSTMNHMTPCINF